MPQWRRKPENETSAVKWLREASEKEVSDSPLQSESDLNETDVSMIFEMDPGESDEERRRRENEKLPPIAPVFQKSHDGAK